MSWCPMAERDLAAQSAETGHEVSDISPRRVALVGLALAADRRDAAGFLRLVRSFLPRRKPRAAGAEPALLRARAGARAAPRGGAGRRIESASRRGGRGA